MLPRAVPVHGSGKRVEELEPAATADGQEAEEETSLFVRESHNGELLNRASP